MFAIPSSLILLLLLTCQASAAAAASDDATASTQLFRNATTLPSAMSDSCKAALLANISCSELVAPAYIVNQGYLDNATLTTLCTSTCASSIADYRTEAESTCGSDPYEFPGNYSQSVAAVTESYLWAYDVACVQSGDTFCVPAITNASAAELSPCSDCFLKYQAAMQGSAYGQALVAPSDFTDLLSSCSAPASSYPTTSFVAPSTTVSVTSSVSSSVSATATCTGTAYTVAAGDSCLSIAAANSVATDRFITENNYDYNCTTIATGQDVCIPDSCTLHIVQTNDTCSSILADQEYYQVQLVSWNPTLHANCDNLDSMIGRGLCISPPGTTSWDVVTTNLTTSWNVTFVLPTTSFTNLPNQTAMPNYTTSYQLPFTSLNISTETLTMDPAAVTAFVELTVYCPITSNDTIDGWTIYDLPEDCQSDLEVYCLPSSNATQPTSTVFPSTCSPAYWESDTTTSSIPAASTGGGAPAPTQTGVASNCDDWYVVVVNDTCADIVNSVGDITLDQFYSWNPAVGSSCQYLGIGYAVCIGVSGSTSASGTDSSIGPTSTAPSPVMPSTDPECTSYYFVESGDTCIDIESTYSISADEFNEWNPYIGTDCANLWASEYICVGAPYTATATPTPTPTSTVPSPLMPSTDADCTKWHDVASGDTCYDIEETYSITATQFNNWNPYVGPDCANLWLGYYVCVAAPN